MTRLTHAATEKKPSKVAAGTSVDLRLLLTTQSGHQAENACGGFLDEEISPGDFPGELPRKLLAARPIVCEVAVGELGFKNGLTWDNMD